MSPIDRDHLTAYALGILPPEEAARVHAAVEADPELRALLRADQEALTALVGTLPPAEVPQGAEERLMARLARERAAEAPAPLSPPPPPAAPGPAPARRRAWLPLAALGLAAALAFLVFRPPADPLSRYARTPGATSQTLTANGAALGQLVRLPGGRAYVQITRPADSGRVYQLWQLQGNVPVSLGVFEGQGLLVGNLPPGATVAVSVEPPGGSPQPTTTPILVQKV